MKKRWIALLCALCLLPVPARAAAGTGRSRTPLLLVGGGLPAVTAVSGGLTPLSAVSGGLPPLAGVPLPPVCPLSGRLSPVGAVSGRRSALGAVAGTAGRGSLSICHDCFSNLKEKSLLFYFTVNFPSRQR